MAEFHSKENIPGNVFCSSEKLGSIPEHYLIDGEDKASKATQKKLLELELQLCSGDGEKRIAIIDNTYDKKSIIPKRLSCQIQKLSGSKRSNPPLEQKEVIDQSNKKPLYEQTQSTFNDAQRLGLFNGDSKLVLTKKEIEREFKLFVSSVDSVEGVNELKIFDSRPEVAEKVCCTYVCHLDLKLMLHILVVYFVILIIIVNNSFLRQIKTFLRKSGVDRNLFSRSLKIQGKLLNSFLLGKNQDNDAYKTCYVFFEKLRIYVGESKSASRCINEANHPNGFTLKKATKNSNNGVVNKGTFLCPSVHDLC